VLNGDRYTFIDKDQGCKAIEAKGIAKFQEAASEGISDQLLKWKAIIETPEKIADCPNSKLVIMGSGTGSMPRFDE